MFAEKNPENTLKIAGFQVEIGFKKHPLSKKLIFCLLRL